MIHGTPAEMGFVRTPQFDPLLKVCAGWHVWRTPENVLLALPPGCPRVGLVEHTNRARNTVTIVCLEPEGVHSVWPFKRGVKHGDEIQD